MRLSPKFLTIAAFVLALVMSALIAGGAATVIEQRTRSMVRIELEAAGYSWASVLTDGLLVQILGTAPSEAARFRAVTLASSIVEATRVIDMTDVEKPVAVLPPSFSLEVLRNDDGISLIGLVPVSINRDAFLARITEIANGTPVKDMLEVADYPEPEGWQAALEFGITTLDTLPRSKISVAAGQVAVTAITGSAQEKARIDADLAKRKPNGISLRAEITAPRPVITPFTLRFLIDEDGARFDACSADTDQAKARILNAATAAGATGTLGCTVGMGTPTVRWSEGVEMVINALKDLGEGSATFSDGDISLVANATVSQADFDRVVGELESNLPEVFSLKAELLKRAQSTASGGPEFSATLSPEGQVQLRGRLSDERLREAAETLAKARFGAANVYGATRVDESLPAGWALRSLSAIEVLGQLAEGSAIVTRDQIKVTGVSGNTQASDAVSRILSDRLGETARIALDIRYDKRLDPVLGLPTGPECTAQLNGALTKAKINFEPSASIIEANGAAILDSLATIMKNCADFRMEITGHTDSQGSDEFNLALSQDRATAVLSALRDRRVNVEHLSARGYGEAQPVGSNETEAGREANRRIEFVLLDEAPVNRPVAIAPTPPEAETPADAQPQFDESAMTDAPMEGDAIDDQAASPDETAAGAATGTPPVILQPADANTQRPKARPAKN